MTRCGHPLGTWTCPSGNSVDVFIHGTDAADVRALACKWDTFPLSREERFHYRAVILPAIIRRAAEFPRAPLPTGPRGPAVRAIVDASRNACRRGLGMIRVCRPMAKERDR